MEVVVNRYGSRVRVRDGMFLITNEEDEHLLAPCRVDRICLAESSSISSDAIRLALDNDIELLLLTRSGRPFGRFWSHEYGSTALIRRHQALFPYHSSCGNWIKDLLKAKLEGQMALLRHFRHKRPAFAEDLMQAHDVLGKLLNRLDQQPPSAFVQEADHVRGVEGYAAKAYLQALGALVKRDWYKGVRSRRPAQDRFNAVLNYAYGVLYGRLEGYAIGQGLDPGLGIFHRIEHNRPSLILDLIEPFRPWGDLISVLLCSRGDLHESGFDITDEGVYLNQSGRVVVIPIINEYMETVVQYRGRRRSRYQHMKRHCEQFAKLLKELDTSELFFQ